MSSPSLSLEVCPVCVKKVGDDEEGLQCDDPCNRWFHRTCAGVPKTEYAKISSNNVVKWYCTRADCAPKAPMPDISVVLSSLITKVDNLSTLVNKLSDVPNDTKIIKTEIHSIQEKLNSIEPKLEEFDKRLTSLEQRESTPNQSNIDLVMEEIHERNVRKRNLIVFNAHESSSSQPQAIKTHETGLVASIVESAINGYDISKIKFFRLGSKTTGKIRPIKLIFPSDEDVLQVLRNFSVDSFPSNEPNLQDIKLSRDRSPLELSTLKTLRQELDSRLKAGEKDLTIKYRNGVPKIVQLNSIKKN